MEQWGFVNSIGSEVIIILNRLETGLEESPKILDLKNREDICIAVRPLRGLEIMSKIVFLFLGLWNFAAFAGPQFVTYEGYIETTANVPVTTSTTFSFQIVNSAGSCIIYEESQLLTPSNGHFKAKVGTGTIIHDSSSANFTNLFSPVNLPCKTSGSYTFPSNEARRLYVYVEDSGPQLIGIYDLGSVPSALNADRVAGKTLNDLVQISTNVTQARVETLLAPAVYDNILNLGNTSTGALKLPVGTSAQQPGGATMGMVRFNSDIQDVEFYNGTAWTSGNGGSGNGVTSIMAGTGLTATSMPLVSIGTISVDVGLTAGKILQVAAGDKFPGLDGSDILNLNASNLSGGTVPAGRMPAFSGDVVSTAGTVAMSVQKIRGVNVGTAAPAHLQVLKYNNGTTNWSPLYLSIDDLRSTTVPATNPLFSSYSCTADQTFTWNAPTGQLGCTNIALNASSITAGLVSPARLGIGTASASTFLRGDGTWATAGGADNLGNHTATTNIQLSGHWLSGDGSAEGLFVDPSGNVGIGTSAPTVRLHVAGALRVVDGTQGAGKVLTSDASGVATWAAAGGGSDNLGNHTATTNINLGAHWISGDGTGGEGLNIDPAGNVSIVSMGPGLTVEGTSSTASIVLKRPGSIFGNIALGASGLMTLDSGNDGAEISILPTGKVGIGVGTPAARLDVAGGVRLGNEAVSCHAGLNGTLRYTGSLLQICNGSAWVSFSALMGTTDASVTSLGVSAGLSGSDTTAIGSGALSSITSASYSTAVGSMALGSLSSSNSNTAVGYSALQNTTAHANTAVGAFTLSSNTTGHSNVALGSAAMINSTNALESVAIGNNAFTNGSGTGSVAIGYRSMHSSTGSGNVAIGYQTLGSAISTGNNNTVMGEWAGSTLTTGGSNTVMGNFALYQATTANFNSGLGYQMFSSLTTGNNNSGLGGSTLSNLTTGANNTAVGYSAGGALVGGNNNVAVGFNTSHGASTFQAVAAGGGSTASGNQSIALGASAQATAVNSIAVGYNVSNTTANSVRFGGIANTNFRINGSGDTANAFAVGTDSSNGNGANLSVTGQWNAYAFTVISDGREKKDLEQLQDSLDKILSLQGYRYNYLHQDSSTGPHELGVIAQEVREVFPEAVIENEQGRLAVNYSALIAPLIESVKTQQRQIDSLKTENEALKSVLCKHFPNEAICQP